MKNLFLLLLTSLALSGCITLDNRVACSVARDKAFYVSEYGQIGVASEIDNRDTAVLCK